MKTLASLAETVNDRTANYSPELPAITGHHVELLLVQFLALVAGKPSLVALRNGTHAQVSVEPH